MQKIILIGDSIRMAYQPLVTQKLSAVAEVWGPEENGGTSANVLSHLEEWALQRPVDAIQVNGGLHDLAVKEDMSGNRLSLEQYAQNVRTILERLRKQTQARVIWATTTPVIDEWHREHKSFERRQADVHRYNKAASAIARDVGVIINDLHAVIHKAGAQNCLSPDGVHMNEHGNTLLAAAVVSCVEE